VHIQRDQIAHELRKDLHPDRPPLLLTFLALHARANAGPIPEPDATQDIRESQATPIGCRYR
jgi:hypothetical protein